MTINDKVNILIQDLKESENNRTQNFSSLAVDDGEKITTYCALGCIKRLIYFDTSKQQKHVVDNGLIIEAYGIQDKMTKNVVLPLLYIN